MADSIAGEIAPRSPGDGGWWESTPAIPALSREPARGCLYLSGDRKPWIECGEPIVGHGSYCPACRKLCFVRMPAREFA